MKTERYLQHIERKYFQKQHAMYTDNGYVFPALPKGFEEVDTQEARDWEQECIRRNAQNMADYYEKNGTRGEY